MMNLTVNLYVILINELKLTLPCRIQAIVRTIKAIDQNPLQKEVNNILLICFFFFFFFLIIKTIIEKIYFLYNHMNKI